MKYLICYNDYLGNVRLNYADSSNGLVIKEENNYYPFGLKHKGYNNVITGRDHKYGFGGKEEQDELGLEWHDFHARNYDVALGRWMNIDPLAEETLDPYGYTWNNPLRFSDPTGMSGQDVITFMDDGSVHRKETNDEFDILQDESGENKIEIEHKEGKSQIGELQELKLSEKKTIQYMTIADDDVAKKVFEFAASTTFNEDSKAEFGLGKFSFEDGFSMNVFQTGSKKLNDPLTSGALSPIGKYGGHLDLGGNHLIKNSTWDEMTHSHPGLGVYPDVLQPSGFGRRFKDGSPYFVKTHGFGDRVFNENNKFFPLKSYVYGLDDLKGSAYIIYDAESANYKKNNYEVVFFIHYVCYTCVFILSKYKEKLL